MLGQQSCEGGREMKDDPDIIVYWILVFKRERSNRRF